MTRTDPACRISWQDVSQMRSNMPWQLSGLFRRGQSRVRFSGRIAKRRPFQANMDEG